MPPLVFPDSFISYSDRANTSMITNTTYGAEYAYTCHNGYFVNDAERSTGLLLQCGDDATWGDVNERTCSGK